MQLLGNDVFITVIDDINCVDFTFFEIIDRRITSYNVCYTKLLRKRSMASGYAGVQNPLFFKENTRMFFGDAKDSLEKVLKEIAK